MRKPGRPLSSCPHPTGSCSCERVVINYTIPKSSECACPSESSQPVLLNNGTGRVQKHKSRKSTATFNAAIIEKAIKAAQDGETDSSSQLTRTPTSEGNNASNPSSASSTPRLLPLQKEESATTDSSVETARAVASNSQSSCCKPKPVQAPTKSCCSSKPAPTPQPAPPKKSCCSGPVSSQPVQQQMTQPTMPPSYQHNVPNFSHFPQYQQGPYGMAPAGNNYMHTMPPFNFNTPIYNHMASGYTPPVSMPMTPMSGHVTHHPPEHNCHCGDSCNCFGCAAHPNNATMMEYVRSMHQFMSTGQFGAMPPPTYDVPSYPHQPGYGAEANLAYNQVTPNFVPQSPMGFHPVSSAMSMPRHSVSVGSWSQASTPAAVHTESPFFPPSNALKDPLPALPEPATALKVEETIQSPTFADSPGEGKDEDAVTLSPSAYFWQEMVLPGCNDATGTCQCGDGCECVGCLTHGGHNGVPLEMPTANEQESFSDFVQTDNVTASNTTQFVPYSGAPT